MPVARFQLPDGRVGRFEVPDGTSPDQATSLIEQHVASGGVNAPAAAPAAPAGTQGSPAPAALASETPAQPGGLMDTIKNAVSTVAGGAGSGIETAGRMIGGLVGQVAGGAGVGAGVIADRLKGIISGVDDTDAIAERAREGMSDLGQKFVPKSTLFDQTPALEELVGHAFESGKGALGRAAALHENLRGAAAEVALPSMMREIYKARPEAAQSIVEGAIDASMVLPTPFALLKGVRGARVANAARNAATDEARFQAARDVTPEPPAPPAPALPAPPPAALPLIQAVRDAVPASRSVVAPVRDVQAEHIARLFDDQQRAPVAPPVAAKAPSTEAQDVPPQGVILQHHVGDERAGGSAPEPGKPFIVFRVGDRPDLTFANAGNADSVARHILNNDDFESPTGKRGIGQTITAFEVTSDRPFGQYVASNGRTGTPAADVGRTSRGSEIGYSFPQEGFKSRAIGTVPLDQVREVLKRNGVASGSFDEAGTNLGARAIREAFGMVDKPERPVIPKSERNLAPNEREAEQHFADATANDLDGMVQRYAEKFGNVVNTDNARELSQHYSTGAHGRRDYAAAVHEPASYIAKEVYNRMLASPVGEGMQPRVLFTAGGTGAGKSTAITKNDVVRNVAAHSDIVFDTNMNNFSSAKKKIDQALASGRSATILAVYRDPVLALTEGSLKRAMNPNNGRTVPVDEHANTHVGMAETMPQLREAYANDPRVDFITIDNNGNRHGERNVRSIPPNEERAFDAEMLERMGSREKLTQELRDAVEQERVAGRISNEVAAATQGAGHSDVAAGMAERAGKGRREIVETGAEGGGQQVALRTAGPEAFGFKDRKHVNGMYALEGNDLANLQRGVARAVENGMPAALLTDVSYVGYSNDVLPYAAAYWPGRDLVGLSRQWLDQGKDILHEILVHETAHHLDWTGSGYMSQSSARFNFEKKRRGMLVASGDLAEEIFDATAEDRAVADLFDYPLLYVDDGTMTHAQAVPELFAQAARLYNSDPAKVRDLMPRVHQLMEEVYGSKDRSLSPGQTSVGETRERLRAALQDNDAAVQGAGRVGRDARSGGSGESIAASDSRGGAGSGMGERVAGPQGVIVGGTPPRGPAATGSAGQRPAGWSVREPGLIDNVVRQLQNNKIDLHRVQDAIEIAAGTLPDAKSPRLLEELFRGRVRTKIERATEALVKPMLKAISDAKSKISVDDVGNYLWARHAPERNAQMLKINPGGPDNLSGLSNAEARKIMQDFRSAGQLADLNNVAALVDKITAASRQMIVAGGLESTSTVRAWENAYRDYVPLFRDVDGAGTGVGSFEVRGPESKRAMGSQKEAVNIVAAVIAQMEKAITRVEKNRVGSALVDMAEAHPAPDFWRVDSPPTKRVINKSTGLVESIIDPLYKGREDVFTVKQKDAAGNVIERSLTVNERNKRALALSRAMNNMDAVSLDGMTKVVGKVTRLMANLATSWNPVFWATNAARDVQTATVNLQAGPLKGLAPQVLSNIPRAIAGIASAEFKGGTGQWAQRYREFENQGAKMGWGQFFDDLVAREKEIKSMIAASQRSGWNPAKWAEVAIDYINKTNSMIENATRLSIYNEALKVGQSPKQAASIAKNATVNFDRKGDRSSAIGAWYMFFNAQMQGTAILFKNLIKSHRVQGFVGAMTAFAAALQLVNSIIGDRNRDEGDNNPYDLIPEHVKSKNMIFMLPKGSADGTAIKDEDGAVSGHYVSIPLPYGFSIFHNAGRMMMEIATRNTDLVDERASAGSYAWRFADTLLDNFGPLGGSSTLTQYAAPTVVKPVVQAYENETWYGSPIHPEPMASARPKPKSDTYFRSTSDTAKDLAKWLSGMSGGDDVRGGALDVYPGSLEHVFQTVTGGTGRFGLGMFDFTRNMIGRAKGDENTPDLPARNIPFVGKFYGEVDERDVAARYYRLSKEATLTYKQYREYVHRGDQDGADKLETEKPELVDMGRVIDEKSHKSAMARVRKDFNEVNDLPSEQRAKARQEIKREEVGIMNAALKRYNEAARERKLELKQ